jgi:outer membrane protein insertion porin family
MRVLLALVAIAAGATPARAEEPSGAETATVDTGAVAERGEFGPTIVIEQIAIIGNDSTRRELILRSLPFAIGDELLSGDPRLRKARFKVLSLGFFRDVVMTMRRGSARGRVIVIIEVQERGTVVLNRLWFGSSTVAPWWVGADLSERNLLGTGWTVGAGLIYASHDEVLGSRDQWAGEVRVGVPAIGGSAWSGFAALTAVHGSEAYRVSGPDQTTAAENLRAFDYQRLSARAGASYNLSALTQLSSSVRVEGIDAALPVAPTRTLDDNRVAPVALHLAPGSSRIVVASVTYDHDNRPDPLLPHTGSRLTVTADISAAPLYSSYDFVSIKARYEHWWPLRGRRHAVGLRLGGGAIIGQAPRFEWIHIAEVNRMLSPRALGLLVSLNAPVDLLQTSPDKPTEGEFGGSGTLEYAYRLFGKNRRRIYGGDLFLGAGIWGLSDSAGLRARDRSLWRSLPIDLFVDAGLRIDTDIGVFELTIANAFGRIPR